MFNVIRNTIIDTYRLIKTVVKQSMGGFDVPPEPMFGGDKELTAFKRFLSEASGYIEYGAGGSTVMAAGYNIPMITVEHDKVFLANVKEKIVANGKMHKNIILLHKNLGPVGRFGNLLFTDYIGDKRKRLFREYVSGPWQPHLEAYASQCDFVLVDGRFRVACALYAIEQFQSRNFRLVVDDYEGRPEYSIIEKYAVLEEMIGRMAVFRRNPSLDQSRLMQAQASFIDDYR